MRKKKAAIIQYGPATKIEHSIIYVSEVWSELVSLLESPCDFLRAKGFEDSPIAWTLLQGATVIVEPMDVTEEVRIRSAVLLKIPPDPDPFQSPPPPGAPRLELLQNGSFIAEFAVYTRTLWIRYWCPEDVEGPKFAGKLKGPATHVPLTDMDGEKLKIGNMHVDIESNLGRTERHRAQFIVDFIEDGSRFAGLLNHATMTRERNDAVLGELGIQKPLKVSTATKAENKPFEVTTNKRRVVMEGASIPELPTGYCVCIDGDTREGDRVIMIDGVLVKCYAIPPGTPGP